MEYLWEMRILVLLLMFFSFSVNAQNRNSIWCFGDSAGVDFSNVNNPIPISTSIRSIGTCSSIADSSGHLLFYVGNMDQQGFDHGVVWNKNHDIMQNGEGLLISHWHYETIIIPNPASSDLYYIFQNDLNGPYSRISYSVVDLSQDGGNGSVTLKNVPLLDSLTGQGSGAVKHANGRDWWVIFPRFKSGGIPTNEFNLFLVTPNGISAPIQLNLGATFVTNSCDITFSVDGTRMVFSTLTGLVEVMDFDRCSGNFINVEIVEPETPGVVTLFSNSISQNNKVVYVTSTGYTSYLFQYDLTANPINLSKDTIATFSWPHNATGTLRMGENEKIYLSNIYYNFVQNPFPYADSMYNTFNMNLSVINNPDSLGAACNFQAYSFYLGGKRTYYGLPNNPNYELGPVIGSVCDSLIGIKEIEAKHNFISVIPNPFTGFVKLHFSHFLNESCQLLVFNSLGEVVLEKQIHLEDQILNLSELTKGIYLLSIRTETGIFTQKIIRN